ncbi:MAG: hypothetical protein C4346_06635 [Chloroflexota bacterium]
MGALRIAHLSDTHLGYRAFYKADPVTGRNQRALDIERAYETVISDILTRDVDLVIHSGDVFHHTRPAYSAMRAFVRQTRRLETAGVPVVVIAGNHETPRLRTSGSVFSVLELALPEVRFVTGYDLETVPFAKLNLRVVAIPHGRLADPLPPVVYPERGVTNVLVLHGLVPGLALGGSLGRRSSPRSSSIPSLITLPSAITTRRRIRVATPGMPAQPSESAGVMSVSSPAIGSWSLPARERSRS